MIFGIHWVLPDKVASILLGWRNWFGKRSSNVWNLVLAYVMVNVEVKKQSHFWGNWETYWSIEDFVAPSLVWLV